MAKYLIRCAALLAALLLAGCNGDDGGNGIFNLAPPRVDPVAITGPTLEQYMNYAGPAAKEIDAGSLTLNGKPTACGSRPTVMNPKLDSWGGSFPGYLILNPDRLQGLATPVKFYIYNHECGHQFVGASETGADCFSIHTGVKQGWLNEQGMDQICAFISQLKGDAVHPPGPVRCNLMRQCYAQARQGKQMAAVTQAEAEQAH